MDENELLSISPYRVYPPLSGGGSRTFHLNRGLSRAGMKIMQFSGSYSRRIEGFGARSRLKQIAPSYQEWLYFNPFLIVARKILARKGAPEVAPSLLPRFILPSPVLWRELHRHRIVLLEQPYWFDVIAPHLGSQHILALDSHNIESALFPHFEGIGGANEWLLGVLKGVEGRAMRAADIVFTCSEGDKAEAVARYGIDSAKIHVAPNGADIEAIQPAGPLENKAAKRLLGLDSACVVLFIGTYWPPNVAAVRRLLPMAETLSQVTFLIVGTVSRAFEGPHPPNVRFLGFVDDLRPQFAAADIAINPMVEGSGSNVKMFDYLAAGLPVLSTPVGARGVARPDQSAVTIAELDAFPQAILDLAAEIGLAERRKAARRLAVEHHDWDVIAMQAANILRASIANRR